MNGSVVRVRRIQDNAVEDFSALQVASGSIEKFAIGQDVLDLYNNAAYFPTDSDYFSLGSGITLSGAFTISYDVVFTGSFSTNTSRIFQDDIGNDLLTFTASNVCKFRVATTVRTMPTLSTPLELGRKYSMIFARDGSGNYTLTIDGVQVSSVSSSDTDDFLIQRIGFRNRGSISNLNINSGQHIYAGDGAENSNWLDTGSGTTTNATKVGTPVAFTGQGIDAFVDTWFDQSGNGRDLIQATTGNQCHIIEDGAYVGGVKSAPASSSTTNSNKQYMRITGTNSFACNDFTTTKVGMIAIANSLQIGSVGGVSVYTVMGNIRGVQTFPTGALGLQISGATDMEFTNYTSGTTENKDISESTRTIGENTLIGGTMDNRNVKTFTFTEQGSDTDTVTASTDIVLTSQKDFGIFYSTFANDSGGEDLNVTRTAGGIMKEAYILDGDIIDDIDDINLELRREYNLA
jgi:hypothetical protein